MSVYLSTNVLDHIVHLTSPGSVKVTAQQFRDLGFIVTPGGTHADGLTENALIILPDGVYLELISFNAPPSAYPPGSPGRQKRDNHPWAHKALGWIDYAFLGAPEAQPPISEVINARYGSGNGRLYASEVPGGRKRPDGKILEWVITAPVGANEARGLLPFFCGDVTPREWRVPPLQGDHPSGTQGISHLKIVAYEENLISTSEKISAVLGYSPSQSDMEYVWNIQPNHDTEISLRAATSRLILTTAETNEEHEFLSEKGPGVYEVAFKVGQYGKPGIVKTPYARIVFSQS